MTDIATTAAVAVAADTTTAIDIGSTAANVFVKNLDAAIDNKTLYENFSIFGSIVSCKVATDDEGTSKGYAFVHFETEEAAEKAVAEGNGMTIAGNKLFIGKFQTRAQREREMEESQTFTNVFVKNFGEGLDDEKLKMMFEKFGQITRCAVMRDSNGKSKGFGFVAFENHEAAEKAVKQMHDTIVDGSENKLFVSRPQRKTQRQAESQKKEEGQKAGGIQQGVNLYVKNFDASIDDEGLLKHFEPFGKITSAKVMTDENGRSKCFGFVCFEKGDDANKALNVMNSKMISPHKPLYVAIAERKQNRREKLAAQFMKSEAKMRTRGNMPAPNEGGYYVMNNGQMSPVFVAGAGVGHQGMVMGHYGAWGMQRQQQMQCFVGQAGVPMVQNGAPLPAGNDPNNTQPHQFTQGTANQMTQPRNMNRHQPTVQNLQIDTRPVATLTPQGAPAVQKQYAQSQLPHAAQGPTVGGQVPYVYTQVSPQEQKQQLGERIYAQIQYMYGGMKDAAKITGMMMELDNAELMMIIQDVNLLRSRVEEAVTVLRQSFKKPSPSQMQPVMT